MPERSGRTVSEVLLYEMCGLLTGEVTGGGVYGEEVPTRRTVVGIGDEALASGSGSESGIVTVAAAAIVSVVGCFSVTVSARVVRARSNGMV